MENKDKAEEILRNKIEDYNANVNAVGKFMLNDKETEMFIECMEEYASYQSQQPTGEPYGYIVHGGEFYKKISPDSMEMLTERYSEAPVPVFIQQPTGPVWVNLSERFPIAPVSLDVDKGVIFRNQKVGNVINVFLSITPNVKAFFENKIEEWKWLDESQSAPIKEDAQCTCEAFIGGWENGVEVCIKCRLRRPKFNLSAPIKEDAPIWYTKEEINNWMRKENYAEVIRKELAEKWAESNQYAFKKGWEKGRNDESPYKTAYEYFPSSPIQKGLTEAEIMAKAKEFYIDNMGGIDKNGVERYRAGYFKGFKAALQLK